MNYPEIETPEPKTTEQMAWWRAGNGDYMRGESRAYAIMLRTKEQRYWWRAGWDAAFGASPEEE